MHSRRRLGSFLTVLLAAVGTACTDPTPLPRTLEARISDRVEHSTCDATSAELRQLRCAGRLVADQEALLWDEVAGNREVGGGVVARAALTLADPTRANLLRARELLLAQGPAAGPQALLVQAAVEHSLASTEDDALWLARSLETTLAAIERGGASPAALFNRALVSSQIGLCKVASRYWQEYLDRAESPEWIDEATARSQELPCRSGTYHPGPRAGSAVRDTALRELLPAWLASRRRGDSEAALTQLAAAADLLDQSHSEPLISSLLDELHQPTTALVEGLEEYAKGRQFWNAEDFLQAGIHYDRAIEYLDTTGSVFVDWIRLQRAGAGLETNPLDEAVARLEELRAVDMFQSSPSFRGHLLWKQGLALLRDGRPGPALSRYEGARNEFDQAAFWRDAASVASLHSSALTSLGLPTAAWNGRVSALRALRFALPVFTYHNNLIEGAMWAAEAGLTGVSRVLLEEARNWGTELEPHAPAEVLLTLGESFSATGNPIEAGEYFRQALAEAHQYDSEADGKREITAAAQLGILATLASADNAAENDVAASIEHFRRAGPRIFHLKALRVGAAIAERRGDLDTSRQRINAALDVIRAQSDELVNNARFDLGHWESVQGVFDDAIDVALRAGRSMAALQLLEEARGFGRASSGTTAVASSSWPDQRPPAGSTVVALSYVREHVVWWKFTHTSVSFGRHIAPDLGSEIQHLAQQTQAGVARAGTLMDMYQQILAPVLNAPDTIEDLVLVPDGILLSVPFAALVDEDGQRLIETWRLSFRRSVAGALVDMPPAASSRPRADWTATVVGDPAFDRLALPRLRRLPGAEAEARALEQAYGSARVHFLLGPEATAGEVRRLSAQSEILHIAAHAIPGERGSSDAIVLSTPPGGGGPTDARELLPPPGQVPRLVVLSACSTLGRHPTRSAGLSGLAEAFRNAGADAVIGTLWPLDDEVLRDLFESFHTNFASGLSASESLRRAQLLLMQRHDSDESRCCGWAGARLVGSIPRAATEATPLPRQ